MRIGIDVGGTKIEGIAIGLTGETLFRERISTPVGDYPGTLKSVAALVRKIEEQTGQSGTIGVGIPGAISPDTGLVKNANSTCLIGERLDADLRDILDRDIRVANDADCFALSEAIDGAGADYASVFGVILGTGVGGGLVIGGTLVQGPNAISGEWGHNRLPALTSAGSSSDDGAAPMCYCGRTGCIETYLSGPALSRRHFDLTGKMRSVEEISDAAETGNTDAQQTLMRYEEDLARGLAMVINIVDPAAIVLGGGISNLTRLYANIPRLLTPHVFSDTVHTALLPPKYGDSSGVRGAAWLWPAASGSA
jgi:fructokinase